jgi:hypothetical protein
MMEAISSSETLVHTRATWCHISEKMTFFIVTTMKTSNLLHFTSVEVTKFRVFSTCSCDSSGVVLESSTSWSAMMNVVKIFLVYCVLPPFKLYLLLANDNQPLSLTHQIVWFCELKSMKNCGTKKLLLSITGSDKMYILCICLVEL